MGLAIGGARRVLRDQRVRLVQRLGLFNCPLGDPIALLPSSNNRFSGRAGPEDGLGRKDGGPCDGVNRRCRVPRSAAFERRSDKERSPTARTAAFNSPASRNVVVFAALAAGLRLDPVVVAGRLGAFNAVHARYAQHGQSPQGPS